MLETNEQELRRAQELVAQYIPPDSSSLADELLEERRSEPVSEQRLRGIAMAEIRREVNVAVFRSRREE